MFCPKHPQQKMTVLFTSVTCDLCERKRDWMEPFELVEIVPVTVSFVTPAVLFRGEKVLNLTPEQTKDLFSKL